MAEPAENVTTWRLAAPFRSQGAKGWIADLPAELHSLTDRNEEPNISRLRLFEDGRALGPAHAAHANIRDAGGGSYSFWIDVLYFSTPDGGDPNVGDRVYTIDLAPPQAAGKPAAGKSANTKPVSDAADWQRPGRPLRCALLGLGNRGIWLGTLAQQFAGVEVAWVVDESRERIAEALKLFRHNARGTIDFVEALADPTVDIVIVAVPDYLHREVAVPAFLAGKHVFLEKPLATTAADAAAILAAWRQSGRILQLGYVLRQAPFYDAIRSVVRDGTLGPIRVASLSEHLDVRHGASFMRRWHAESRYSGGLLVHKACHDLDIICWLLNGRPQSVSSFGGLDTFAAPAPAKFCTQCDRRRSCPHVDTGLHERRTPAERANPSAYGLDRCVFRPEKDIVDNQVVSFVLDTGTRGNFYLAMQRPVRSERRITLVGDDACLDGVFEDGRFTVSFADAERPPLTWEADERSQGGHGGGDRVTMLAFLNACTGHLPPPVTNSEEAMRGLIFALAAERARKEGIVVQLDNGDFVLN